MSWFSGGYFGTTTTPVVTPPPPITVTGPTLADIERATARRIGPYFQYQQSADTSATPTLAYVDALNSSTNPGGVVNLNVLRRGKLADGTVVTVGTDDRQRVVADYDPLVGSVQADRAWTTPPAAGEVLEFYYLDPANELRVAVLDGLKRCFFEDRATIALATVAGERNLTALIPWLTKTSQIVRIQVVAAGQTTLPSEIDFARPFQVGGNVWLATWPDPSPLDLLVTAWRPHFTLVNGADSLTGPLTDDDVLTVDIEYAATAAHIEAWRLFPSMMQGAAAAGYQATQQMTAVEFTRQAVLNRRRHSTAWRLNGPFNSKRPWTNWPS